MSVFRPFCLTSFVLAALPLSAQTPVDSLRALQEVVVTANRFREIIPAQTLKGDELEKLNSFSVADAIRFFSGVQIKDYGGIAGLKTVNIRSMGTNHMGVFYNGLQLGNAQNGQVDLGKFSLDNIEEISLYNGQKSEIFQSAKEFGSAGSIYLTTRKPKFSEGSTTNLRAGLRAGSFGLLNPSLLYEHRINDRLTTTFNAEWVNADGKYPFRYRRVRPDGELAYDTTAVRHNGDIDGSRMEGSLQGYLSEGFWKVHVYHYESERGVPGAIVNNDWRSGERLWDRNSFVQGVYQQDLTDRWSAKINWKYASDYTRYVNYDSRLMRVDNIYRQKEIYFSWANRYALSPNWDVSAAYDFQWNGLSEYLSVSRGTHWLSLATAFVVADRLKMQASLLGTYVDEEARRRDTVVNKKELSPAVFLSWQPVRGQGLVVRAFYKQSFRMPTFNDLYYTDMGNAYLRPEYAAQCNAGVSYDLAPKNKRLHQLHFGVDAYYNRVKDKIIAYPKGQQFRWTMLNLGLVDIRGIDVTGVATVGLLRRCFLTGKLQYTYQRAIDVTDPAKNYYRHQIPYIPHHSGSATAMFACAGWSLNYSFIYAGERYNQQENIVYNHTQPWYTSDVSATHTLRIYGTKMKLSAEINNLFSQDYDVVLNYPMPKRNYRLRLQIEL